MVYRNRSITILLITASFLLLAVKLFTAVISLSDDPTRYLVIKAYPSLNNYILESTVGNIKQLIVASDENKIIGEGFYFFATKYLWWLFLVGSITYLVFSQKSTNTLTSTSSRNN